MSTDAEFAKQLQEIRIGPVIAYDIAGVDPISLTVEFDGDGMSMSTDIVVRLE